jgi:hypothetical protein
MLDRPGSIERRLPEMRRLAGFRGCGLYMDNSSFGGGIILVVDLGIKRTLCLNFPSHLARRIYRHYRKRIQGDGVRH